VTSETITSKSSTTQRHLEKEVGRPIWKLSARSSYIQICLIKLCRPDRAWMTLVMEMGAMRMKELFGYLFNRLVWLTGECISD